jgi:hypothetical protein
MFLRSHHSAARNEPEQGEQDARPNECDDGQGHEAGHAYAHKPREPAAKKGTDNANDDVPYEPKAVSGYDLTGKKTGYRSNDDEDNEIHPVKPP